MDRCQGYMTSLLENGIEINRQYILIPSDPETPNDCYEKAGKMIDAGEVDAFFCFNDQIAFKMIEIIKKRNKIIPDDIGVIGYDNIEACNSQSPALTSISYKTTEIGQKAAEVLYHITAYKKLPSML